jgi:hypothetical protein
MKPLDRQSLDEQTSLVSRYVAGDLSRSERADFEAWLVASPELAAEVEMERRLRRGIASAARRGWLKRGVTQNVSRERRWRIAMAASLVVAMATLGLSLGLPERSSEHLDAPHLSASPSKPILPSRIVHLATVRGITSSPDISVSLADAPGEIVVEPDVVVLTCENGAMELECANGSAPNTPQYEEYEMDLVARRGSALAWRSARQAPASDAQLTFTLRDPGALTAGDYDLIVRGHSPDHEEVVARFWLRVSAQ